MAAAPPRTPAERLRDTRTRFEEDVDTWVSTASPDGAPYLIPLSFLWDGEAFLISTVRTSPTSRNLLAGGTVRLAFGEVRDVVIVEGVAEALEPDALTDGTGDAFAAKTGFDPRALSTPYTYFRIRPERVQAWREANELAGRDLMRHGRWLEAGA